jgi:S-adenosylmethionine:tRNA ribosyltransferase-isomerase
VIAADRPRRGGRQLLVVDAQGGIRHLAGRDLATLFEPGDLVVANDAATIPASLFGTHVATGAAIEVRLAGWDSPGDPTRFVAVVFGRGDHRVPTEHRPAPPRLAPGDRLALGPLAATVDRVLGNARLIALSFAGNASTIWAGLARHGRPLQFGLVPAPLLLSDAWTRIAAAPVAFEPPSAGFVLDWRTLAAWRRRGIDFATLTLAAGISSTGHPALDARLPFDEPYGIPPRTASAIARTRSRGGRIIAVGTTVVRALEAAGAMDGRARAGDGIATGRIETDTELRVVDAILTGVHQPGESHFELLRAFTDDGTLDRAAVALESHGYRSHEFGDSVLIERRPRLPRLLHHADDRPVAAVPRRIVAAKLGRIDAGRAPAVQK